ncbi:MAG: LD-carboxypeptidase [Bacteroidetes bacterium]|nr:LD-carboxypeptidase [Bacteroidota bacterium]
MYSSQTPKLIKPKRLPKNGTIAVTSPATTPDLSLLNLGVSYLEKLGYTVVVGKTCTSKLNYLAGDDQLRASELMNFFEDPNIDAIMCARGGYGGMHLLPLLDFDRIAKNPKLLIGFSDITTLEWALLAKCNMVTVSGGMVASDMGYIDIDPVFESKFWDLLDTGLIDITLQGYDGPKKFIEGTILPGTLAVAAKQMGSAYFPDMTDRILVFEDVDEPMHKIEGYLRQFALSGAYNKASGIIFGEFSKPENEINKDVPLLETVFQRVLEPFDIPFIGGLNYGHIDAKISLPVGVPISVSYGPVTTIRSTGSIFEN